MRTMAAALLLGLAPLAAVTGQATPDPTCDGTNWRPECSTPGTSLALTEAMRQRVQRDVIVGYYVTAKGVPEGKIYGVWHAPVNGDPFLLMTGFTPDSGGTVVCGDSTSVAPAARQGARLGWCKRPLADVGFTVGQFVRGEPYRLALISTDDSVRVYGEIIPHPLEATNGACRITAEMGASGVYVLRGSGFRPGEPVESRSRSGGTQETTLAADSAGNVGIVAVVAVPGKKGGDASQEFRGAACRVKLEYGWGDRALRP